MADDYDYGFPEIKHYLNEIGTQIIIDCGQDISTSTTSIFKVRKPDGTLVDWTATVTTIDTLPNYLSYYTQLNDFDQIGMYSIQPYIVLPTWTGRGETVNFNVLGNFDIGY